MKITIANKKLLTKPQTVQEKKGYFNNLLFKSGNFQIDTFKKVIENGCTITYLFKDDVFDRSNHYMVNNYKGTQFICVDIDKCDISPKAFIENIKYKPTFYHTTFSNLTEVKDNKYCFHLIYCFDEVVEGEDNFSRVFNTLTSDYTEYVDDEAKDCHRVIYTSNSTLPNFEYGESNIIYKVQDLLPLNSSTTLDDFDSFFDGGCTVTKNEDAYILSSPSINMQAHSKNVTPDNKKNANPDKWFLDREFYNDLNSMSRKSFVEKYTLIYPYINRTLPKEEQIKQTKEGIVYEDWRGYDYCEIPSKIRFVDGKATIARVQDDNRTKSLMFDCFCFIKCIPNITKEYLVTMLVNEVFRFYSNADQHMTTQKILGIAKYGWNMRDNIHFNKPLKKNFKIVSSIDMSKNKAVGLLNKLKKDEEIGNNLDLSLSLEANIELMKSNGVSTTKARLIQFCNDYEVELLSEKDMRNKKIIEICNLNPDLSVRKLQELCNENGIDVNYNTIRRLMK